MGAQVSKASSKTVNVAETIAKTLISNVQGASGTLTQQQAADITIGGNFTGSITQDSLASINFSALQTAQNTASLQQAISNSLKQAVEAATSGQNIGGQVAMTENDIQNINNISSSIDISSVANCAVNASQSQNLTLKVGGNASGIVTQSAGMDILAKCIQNSSSVSQSVQDLQNKIDQSASSKTEGFISAAGIIVIVIVVFIIAMVGAWWYLFGGGEETTSNYMNNISPKYM